MARSRLGAWLAGVVSAVLTLGLLWAIPRFPILNPVPAHWLQPTSTTRLDRIYQGLRGFYLWFGSLSQTVSDVLEGDAGLMWTLLFLVLFIVMIAQRTP